MDVVSRGTFDEEMAKFWFAEYINSLYGDMGVPFQARSRYIDVPHAAKLI